MRKIRSSKVLTIEQRREQFAALKQLFGGMDDQKQKENQCGDSERDNRTEGVDQVDKVQSPPTEVVHREVE